MHITINIYSPVAILDEEYAEKQLNKMEKQTNKLEGALKQEKEEGPKFEVQRAHDWFQTPKEKREEKERLALPRTDGKGKGLNKTVSLSNSTPLRSMCTLHLLPSQSLV